MAKQYLIDRDDYIRMGVSILEQFGVSKENSLILINNFLDCDEKGIYTHGIVRLPTYLMQIKRGNLKPNPQLKLIKNDPIVKLMDGDHGIGAVVGYCAMKQAIKICKKYGIGVVGVRNSSHFGAAAYYTEMASQANLIGITFSNASPGIAPTGSKRPLLGNNPWSISAPTNKEFPITMDIANSIVARGKIRLAAARGESIPVGWALNKYGEPTTDPKEALDDGAILPIGGHKGYGLTLMIEILTGVLTGSGFGLQNAAVMADGKRKNGQLFISLDIEKFMEVIEFKDRVDELIEMIKSSPKINENEKIFLPGEIEWSRKLKLKNNRVILNKETYDTLKELALKYHVKF